MAEHEKWGRRSGVRIRVMGEPDLEGVLELRSVVRWATEPEAFELLRGMREARWAVAEGTGGTLAGMVGAVPLGRVGILCHLAVRDRYRRRGIGTGLSAWAVAYLRSRGAQTIRLYSTWEAEGIYRSLGFKPVARRIVYRLECAPRETLQGVEAGACGHRVEPLLYGDLPELYGVDYWAYGADRSHIIFATLRLHPGAGLVARDATGRIAGYLLRSECARGTRIGPFVASDPGVARLLLARALAEGGRAFEVAVPGPKEHPAHRILGLFGFEGRRDRLWMEMGGGRAVSGLEHYGTTPYLAT